MTAEKDPVDETVNILIVEDSPTQAEQLKYLLEQNKYNVTTAGSGRQALDLLAKNLPSLIITDIVMPGMTGFELCQKIKSDEKTKEIPVILLTSLINTEDVLEGLACGADKFISKPYNEHYLLSNIDSILLNKKFQKNERVRVGVEIQFGGKKRFVTADQQQMLSMLISTYEAAVNRNKELVHAQEELATINERLEEIVEERTAKLTEEIAERKAAEKKILASLKEKEILLKEIHHRVKNNLQIISSMLNIQKQYLNDDKDIDMFTDCQDRIRSFALVHERLYQTENLSEIAFSSFIDSLINDISKSYLHNRGNIKIENKSDDIYFDIIIATPLAQIITELFTNSLKHAFPDGKGGDINIELKKANGSFTLIYCDNGTGLPKDFKFPGSNNSLGLSLVETFVKQINGALDIDTQTGLKYIITFNREEHKK